MTLCIAVDWSARSAPSPQRPSGDACWLAAGTGDQSPGARPVPEYFRTRHACRVRIEGLLAGHRGRAIVGFDFPMGYPTLASGEPVLPAGRELAALLDGLIADDPETNGNNRFEVACELNRRIRAHTGAPSGPLWGHPPGRTYRDLTPTRPRDTGVPERRLVDGLLASKGIQSAWKLAYTASVGSQTLLGMKHVHALLTSPALSARCRVWPFEPSLDRDDEVTICEIWPGLFDHRHQRCEIRDARQVAEARGRMLADPASIVRTPAAHADRIAHEGWIGGFMP